MKIKFFSILALLLMAVAGVRAATTIVTWNSGDLDGSGSGSVSKDGVTLTPSNGDAHLYTNFYDYGSNTFSVANGNITKIEIVCTYANNLSGWTQELVGQYQPEPDLDPDWWDYIYKFTWTGKASEVTIRSSVFEIQSITFTLATDPVALELSEDNSSDLSKYNGKPCNVTLTRSIVPGSYNTLSLPFDVSNDMLKATFGNDVQLAELSGTRMENETLYFDFTPANAITAGIPYLIYVSADVASPITFNGVTVKEGLQTVETDLADFIPVFNVTTLEGGNENILFLGANNTLYYPSATSGAMKGFRAYFKVKGAPQGAKAMVMMDNSLTGVKTILNENLQNEQVYDLQGRMVTRPAKGLYIVNGKKVIIK